MRKFLMAACWVLGSTAGMAQIPNFGTTVGDQKLYGYTSLKYRAGANTWETYSTWQYGISDYFQTGMDLYTDGDNSYVGYIVRGGCRINDYLKVGAQLTPSFNLGNHHAFSYLTSALYINGKVTADGRLFYVTDTWLENDRNSLTSAKQWTYLGYTFPLGGENSFSAMAGVIHSWKFDRDVDPSFGCYYTHKNISVYAWTNDIATSHPRFILALEFTLNNK